MDKPTLSRNQKKKGNKLVRRLFKWRDNQSKADQAASDSKGASSEDEEQWQRIKNMEQTRTISAMKNHIQKLEEKLDDLKNKGDNNNYKKCNSDCKAVPETSICEDEDSNRSNAQQTSKNNEEEAEVQNTATYRQMDVAMLEAGDTSESGEDILVYVENENDPLKDSAAKSPLKIEELKKVANTENSILYESEEENHPEIEKRLDSGLASDVIDEMTCDELELQTSVNGKNEEWEEDSNIDNGCGIPEQRARSWSEDYTSQASMIDCVEHNNSTTSMQLEEHYRKSSMQDATENVATSKVSHTESSYDKCTKIHEETDPSVAADTDISVVVDTKGNFELDKNLEEMNAELKERVYVLEEQLWLAAEERKNIQAVLELQKERALKNLAFKFEDINRKTLREFKGLFEYRLQELNEEKLKLQEKLIGCLCSQNKVQNRCEECLLLKERLATSEEDYSKLCCENDILKRRCRKLSGDLGKVKKAIGALTTSDDAVGIDVSCETDTMEMERKEIGIQCEINLDMPLSDLRDEIRDIAAKISVISSCLFMEQRQISQGEESFNDNDILNSVSSNNESGIESLQTSAGKNLMDHEDIGDYSAVCLWEDSDRNIEGNIADAVGDSVKHFNHPVDDCDSVITGISGMQLSINDIEKPLLRIHEKYRKISEELEFFGTEKLNRTTIIGNEKANTGVCITELDPEVKRIVDEVNRKYDEYFKTKSIF